MPEASEGLTQDQDEKSRRHGAPAEGDRHRLARQSGRMVRLLRLFGLLALFRLVLLSRRRSGRANAVGGRRLRARLLHAADRRRAVRRDRRPLWAAPRADALRAADVPRLADRRRDADAMRRSARRRRRCCCSRALLQGPEPRRRIWIERHLSLRDGGAAASRILFELSICDADRRPIAGAARAARAAESRVHAAGAARLWLAHSFRHRRAAGAVRLRDAPRPRRDGCFRRDEDGEATQLACARSPPIRARRRR